MARATAAATADRVDQLQRMILAGENNTACLAFARAQWGIGRARGYELLKRAWQQIHDDVDRVGIERAELVAWAIAQLQTATGLALKQNNPGAVVGCVRQLDQLCGLGNHHPRGHRGRER